MRIDYIEGDEYWTAESLDDLNGWEIMASEPWTEAVSRLWCRRTVNPLTVEFHFIYCRNSTLNSVRKVETVQ